MFRKWVFENEIELKSISVFMSVLCIRKTTTVAARFPLVIVGSSISIEIFCKEFGHASVVGVHVWAEK